MVMVHHDQKWLTLVFNVYMLHPHCGTFCHWRSEPANSWTYLNNPETNLFECAYSGWLFHTHTCVGSAGLNFLAYLQDLLPWWLELFLVCDACMLWSTVIDQLRLGTVPCTLYYYYYYYYYYYIIQSPKKRVSYSGSKLNYSGYVLIVTANSPCSQM